MSINYHEPKPQRLHSPLLDGANKNNNNKLKGKRTYFNPLFEKKNNEEINQTLDQTLFNKKDKLSGLSDENNIINQSAIDRLETSFKIASIFIIASGGIVSLLEFINIIRIAYGGSYDFGNSIIIFTIAFIGTILANVICIGFSHLIKTTKYVYLNIENQKEKIDKLTSAVASH